MDNNSLFSDQEIQGAGGGSGQQTPEGQSQPNALPESGSLFSTDEISKADPRGTSGAADTGQMTNDVGNTVIVPKDGESFADTMKRAANYGRTVTPAQLNPEEKTIPAKAATVIAAAPAIGAGGAAAVALPGEAVNAGERVLQMTESQLQRFAEAYPHLSKLATHLGLSATPVGIYELLTHFDGKK